jgi:CPA2 family monovalent cation:H+ antiporter-2
MTNTLELVLVLLASAVLVVALFRLLHLPPLIGYLIAGVAIGPHALGWIPDSVGARYLAEFGVVFLMFSIGLEFSLSKLFQMRRVVFGLGGSQVLLTIVFGMTGAIVIGLGWKAGLVLGGALAMSSTAIAARMLAERMELETPHGREVMGMLLFQDLAVVPLLVIVPALAIQDAALGPHLLAAAGKAAVILLVLLYVGQRLMRPWFHMVVKRRSQELFFLNVLLVTLGLAYLTELAGLSLALGAFIAGMLIAETEYRHQVEDDIKPFREVLLGLFFVTVGMQLDPAVVRENIGLVLFLCVVPVVFKFALISLLSAAFGSSPGAALKNGLTLAQAGEFGLVIVTLAAASGSLETELAQIVTAAMLISMLVAPFLIHFSDRLVLRWVSSEWMMRSLELHRIAVQGLATEGHVIVCGYGRTGQRLVHLVQHAGIQAIAMDPDPERVREAKAAGEAVVFGDGTRREVLVAAGIRRAAAVVITFADTRAALRIIEHARELSPAVPVVVRTMNDADMDTLIAAGAAEVVPETFESSLMLASHALMLVGIPLRRVVRQIAEVRRDRYSLLRGFFQGETDWDDAVDETGELRLRSIAVQDDSFAAGRRLRDIGLEATGARVSVLVRRRSRVGNPSPDTAIEPGDVVVLLGNGRQLEAAQLCLQQGQAGL